MADYLTLRRYYLNKRSAAELREDDEGAALWKAKQLSEAGTPLPNDFPSRSELEACGYETKEDLDGADSEELVTYARLSIRNAEKVIAAHAAV